MHPSCLTGVNDLLSLSDFNEGALLHNIRLRYQQNQIYTAVGLPILVSINPYKEVGIYGAEQARKYKEYSSLSLRGTQTPPPPHLF